MRILFIGSVQFSLKCLKKVVNIGGNVVGVCTLKESLINADFYDLSNFSKKNKIPCKYFNHIDTSETKEWISELKPDIIFCFGWSKLLKLEILTIPRMGVLGFHPTALPANRGRHPIVWTLALGLKKTASTFFFMDHRADTGDILSQKEIDVSVNDDARSLYNKITGRALMQIEEFLPKLILGKYSKIKQDDTKSNTWRKRNKSDGLIDWRMSANTIHNTIRALTKPYIGAEFIYKNVNYKIWKSEVILCDFENIEPGKIYNMEHCNFPIIKCGVNAIKLIEIEPALDLSEGEYL